MKIKQIMTTHVQTVEPSINFYEAARRMRDLDVGILPVVENGRLVGVLTDRDIVVRGLADDWDPKSTEIRPLLSTEVHCCREDQDVSEAEALMKAKQVRRIVVLDARDQVAGIVSLGDIALQRGSSQESGEILESVSSRSTRGRHAA